MLRFLELHQGLQLMRLARYYSSKPLGISILSKNRIKSREIKSTLSFYIILLITFHLTHPPQRIIEGTAGNPEGPTHSGLARAARQRRLDRRQSLRVKRPRTPAAAAARPRRGQTGFDALHDQIALELRQGGERAEDRLAADDGRADVARLVRAIFLAMPAWRGIQRAVG